MSTAITSDQVRVVIRRLAEVDGGDLPVLSVYLDVRPQATGEQPGRRAAFTLLRDRLRHIGRSYGPRGEALDSFRADEERIWSLLENELDTAAQGVAIVACHGLDVWEVVPTGVPFLDSVSSGPRPDLYQLAALVDQFETAVVALVDTNTARLFVSRLGSLDERAGPDEGTDSFRKRQMGGWSQARYQRHIDKHIADFAASAAAAMEELMRREGASRLILAGDEVALTPLRDALSPSAREQIVDVLREDIRAQRDPLQRAVDELLAAAERDQGMAVADQVIGGIRSGGLTVAGARRTREALEVGAVDTLVLVGPEVGDPGGAAGQDARDLATEVEAEEDAGAPDAAERADLVRLAALSGARVEVVDEHGGLARYGGVGALLRYPLPVRGSND